jgi:WD40 repeat protein
MIHALTDHGVGIGSMAFSGDGSRLVTGDWTGDVRMWDVESGELLGEMTDHEHNPVSDVAATSDGSLAVSQAYYSPALGLADPDIYLWDVTAEVEMVIAEIPRDVYDPIRLEFSPDDRLLAVGNGNGLVRVLDVETGRPALRGVQCESAVLDVLFSTDSSRMLVLCDLASVLVDTTTGETVNALVGHPEAGVFAPDALVWNDEAEAGLSLWNLETGEQVTTLNAAIGGYPDYAISPNGALLATRDVMLPQHEEDETLRLWDAATGRLAAALPGTDEGYLYGDPRVFSPDNRLLVTVGDGVLFLWGVQS